MHRSLHGNRCVSVLRSCLREQRTVQKQNASNKHAKESIACSQYSSEQPQTTLAVECLLEIALWCTSQLQTSKLQVSMLRSCWPIIANTVGFFAGLTLRSGCGRHLRRARECTLGRPQKWRRCCRCSLRSWWHPRSVPFLPGTTDPANLISTLEIPCSTGMKKKSPGFAVFLTNEQLMPSCPTVRPGQSWQLSE